MATPCTSSRARCFPTCIFGRIRLVKSHNSNAFLQAEMASQMHFLRRFEAIPCTFSKAKCFPKCIFVAFDLSFLTTQMHFSWPKCIFETIHGDSCISRTRCFPILYFREHSTRHFSQLECISPAKMAFQMHVLETIHGDFLHIFSSQKCFPHVFREHRLFIWAIQMHFSTATALSKLKYARECTHTARALAQKTLPQFHHSHVFFEACLIVTPVLSLFSVVCRANVFPIELISCFHRLLSSF